MQDIIFKSSFVMPIISKDYVLMDDHIFMRLELFAQGKLLFT